MTVRGERICEWTALLAIPTSSWGAHHGPQADMLTGTNAYDFPGKKYSKSAHAVLPKAECVTCHMTLPNGRYSLSPAIGGTVSDWKARSTRNRRCSPSVA